VLVFRGQQLTHEEQRDVMSCIGPIPSPEGMSYVSVDPGEGILGSSELVFHSDNSWSPKPYLAISLLAIDVVDGATATRFASNTKCLAAMPSEFRSRLEGIRVTEVHPFNKGLPSRLEEDTLPNTPEFTRPAILPHRNTGVSYLYVTRMCAKRIEGMSQEQSNAFIQEIFKFIYAPENTYEHRWNKGDLVIWDNLTIQHARGNVQAVGRRYLQRVSCGEISVMDMYPKMLHDSDYHKWLNAPDGHPDEAVLVEVFRKASEAHAGA